MSAIEALQQNDPEGSCIIIELRDETSDANLAQALEQNPFVTDITLDLEGVQQAGWDSLLRVIAMRSNLEKVTLRNAAGAEQRNAPAGLIRSILQAMQQNTSIQSVDLWWLRLPSNISTFVDTASSITSFTIYGCGMEAPEHEQGRARRCLAAALQRNKNIERLSLCMIEGIHAVPILEGLRSNTSVKDFTFSCSGYGQNFSDVASHALHQLLDASTSIQSLTLQGMHFSGDMLHSVAQSLIQSQIICELMFSNCNFHSENSTAQFRSVLQNKQNLTALSVHACHFNFNERQVAGDIILTLSRPGSLLRCFALHIPGSVEDLFPGLQFENLLRSIQKSKLERVSIGEIMTLQQLQTLTQSIPSMKLKELEVEFIGVEEQEGDFDRESIKQHLLSAVKNNFSLRSVKAEMFNEDDEFDFFESDEDKKTLAFYANRNKSLNQWVDHPETVEQQNLWPNALGLAERAGPNALFQGLRSVLEGDYVSLKGGRKRKRTQYYSPS